MYKATASVSEVDHWDFAMFSLQVLCDAVCIWLKIKGKGNIK
jgi:hypothetical protein